MDALVFLFWVSSLTTGILREPIMNDGILAAAELFVSQLLAYVVGRQLIEPDLRFKTVRRFVIFILLLCPIGVYEWRFGQSVYGTIGQKFLGVNLGEYGEGIQLRGGRGRLTLSFSGGEFAGIVIGLTFALNAWLAFVNKARTGVDLGRWLAKLEKYHIPALLMYLADAVPWCPDITSRRFYYSSNSQIQEDKIGYHSGCSSLHSRGPRSETIFYSLCSDRRSNDDRAATQHILPAGDERSLSVGRRYGRLVWLGKHNTSRGGTQVNR
jgi:hypothetical protein